MKSLCHNVASGVAPRLWCISISRNHWKGELICFSEDKSKHKFDFIYECGLKSKVEINITWHYDKICAKSCGLYFFLNEHNFVWGLVVSLNFKWFLYESIYILEIVITVYYSFPNVINSLVGVVEFETPLSFILIADFKGVCYQSVTIKTPFWNVIKNIYIYRERSVPLPTLHARLLCPC